MSASIPPRPSARRPWYLVVALAITMFFGASGFIGGCQTVAEYREPASSDAVNRQLETIPVAEDRDAARASYERYLAVLEARKAREYPLGIAEFLLGAALLALTARAMGNRAGARSLLVQIAAAQAVLVLVAFLATADVHRAWADNFGFTSHIAMPRESLERAMWPSGILSAFASSVYTAWVGVRTLLTVIAIVALTRQGTRAFFDASAPVSQR